MVVVAAVTTLSVCAWVFFRPSPEDVYFQAKSEYLQAPDRARPLLLRAIDAAGGRFPDAELLLCCTLARQDKWQDVPARVQAIDIAACDTELLVEFGRLSFESRHAELAEIALEQVARSDNPQAEYALQMLVAIFHEQQRTDDVLRCAELLVSRAPTRVQNWSQLAAFYEALDQQPDVIDTYRRALQSGVSVVDTLELRHELIEQLILLGDAPEARLELEQLETLVAVHGQQTDLARVAVHQARLLRLEGRPQEALSAVNNALNVLGDLSVVLRLRGLLLLDLGRYEEARADLRRVLEVTPFDEITHYKLAEAYRRLGKETEAKRHIDEYDRIHRARLEIEKLEAKATTEELTTTDQEQLSALYRELGQEQ